jgi:hypothetical protein
VLRPSETPAKLVTTTLKTLNQIVDAVAQEKPWADMSETSSRSTLAFAVSEQIYARPVIDNLAEILSQPSGTIKANQQISLAVRLIMKTCQEESQKKMLVDAGILDMLATKLTAIAAADESSQDPDAKPVNREQLPRKFLADVIEAIASGSRTSTPHASCTRSRYNSYSGGQRTAQQQPTTDTMALHDHRGTN